MSVLCLCKLIQVCAIGITLYQISGEMQLLLVAVVENVCIFVSKGYCDRAMQPFVAVFLQT